MKHGCIVVNICLVCLLVFCYNCSNSRLASNSGIKSGNQKVTPSDEPLSEEPSEEPDEPIAKAGEVQVCVYYSVRDSGDYAPAWCEHGPDTFNGAGGNNYPCHHCDDTVNVKINGKNNTYNFSNSGASHSTPGSIYNTTFKNDKITIQTERTKKGACTSQYCRGYRVVFSFKATVDGQLYILNKQVHVLGNKDVFKMSDFTKVSSQDQYKFNARECDGSVYE